MKLEEAIEILVNNGLSAYISKVNAPHIVGGSGYEEVGEIKVFEDGFTIYFKREKWIVCCSTQQHPFDEQIMDSLESAVNFVIKRKVFNWER